MVTHPSTNPIRRRLTPGTRLLDHRNVHRFANLDTLNRTSSTHINTCSSVSKYNNSPTPSSLRIVSKPDTATREYRKKVNSLQNTCNVDSCTHWIPIFVCVCVCVWTDRQTYQEIRFGQLKIINILVHINLGYNPSLR